MFSALYSYKDCSIKIKASIESFEFNFNTKEKNAHSYQD